MTTHANESAPRKPLRLWPAVAAAVLQCLVWFVIPSVLPDVGAIAILGGFACALIVLVWWLFFSRARWSERLGVPMLMVLAVLVTRPLLHESIRDGLMGRLFLVYVIPALSFALVVWAVVSRGMSRGSRRAAMVAAIVIACGVFTVLRTDGITGDADSDFEWRWTPTHEERLLAQAVDEPAPPAPVAAPIKTPEPPLPVEGPEKSTPPTPALAAEKVADPVRVKREAEWPGFRGPNRDGVIRGVTIETDWSKSPPVELWRQKIGPGWSSFAVNGNLVYTQEQRGEEEIVSCYRLTTGKPVWRHRDAVRFWESNGGPGPRATPTVHDGRVYTFGATGILNALHAGTGAVVWSRNAATDTGREVPEWGFASSPLVFNDIVIVAVAGQLAAYDAVSGQPRWVGPTGGAGYSSPHLLTIDGVPQVLLLRGSRTISVSPTDGSLLWEHSWAAGVGIVQPALTPDGDVLLTTGDAMGGVGMRRISLAHGPSGWTPAEQWTTRGLKPYFNDFVVHKGHAFGFDGSILACIDLADGNRKWKGGRYGHGQMLLFPDQDVLLVLSEEGELALVKATSDQFTELARFAALEGKTWNHPVLVGNILLVRNGEEMAAFRLAGSRR
jgi:outer membrane protein assembly factor BamB